MNNNSTRSYPVWNAQSPRPAKALKDCYRNLFLILMLVMAGYSTKAQAVYATSQANQVNGMCLLCGMINDYNPVNNANLADYSAYAITAGLLGVSVEQTLIFPSANSHPGEDEIVIQVGADNTTLTASLFDGVLVETYNGTTPNNDVQAGSTVVHLTEGGTKAEFVFKPNQTFDRVKITLVSTQVGALQGLRNYYAFYRHYLQPNANGVLFVKKGGSGTGSSWSDALGEVADALQEAKSNPAVRQIWVSGGTYMPLYSGNDNGSLANYSFKSFLLAGNVKMYGGFAGTELSLNERDLSITANQTILSGDIDNNDVASGIIVGSNSLHVVIAVGEDDFHLDGFTIQGGHATQTGALMIVNGSSVSSGSGAAIYHDGNKLDINACRIRGNASELSTVTLLASNVFISNTEITGNISYTYSAIYNKTGIVQLLNNSISGNNGSEVLYNDGVLQADNSIIYGNGGTIVNGTANFNHCILSQTPSGTNLNAVPSFVQMPAYSTAPFTGGNYKLQSGSPAVNAGNNALIKTPGSEGILTADMANTAKGSLCTGVNCSSGDYSRITDNSVTTDYAVMDLPQAGPSGAGRSAIGVAWNGQTIKAGDFIGFVIAQENIPISNPTLLAHISIRLNSASNSTIHTQTGLSLQTTTLNGETVTYIGFTAPIDAAHTTIVLDQIPNTITMLRVLAAFKWEQGSPRVDNPYDLAGKPRIANKAGGGIVDIGAYEVQKQAQTITVSDASKTYGDAAFVPGATASSGLAVTYTSGNTAIAEPFLDAADGKYKLSIKGAGTITITANQAGDGNWEPAAASSFALTVAKKPVTIGIKSTATITKVYNGQAQGVFNNANFEFASGDIINSDDVQAKFTGIMVYDNENAGENKTITINQLNLELEGAKADNYVIGNTADLSFSNASITKAELAVIPTSGQGKIYGETDPVLTYSMSGILYNTDAITGSLFRETGEDAGDYDITQGGLTAGSNYSINLSDDLFTISKKPVIVSFKSSANLSKVYDGTDKSNITSADLGFVAGAIINADIVEIVLNTDAAIYDNRHAGDNKTLAIPYSGLSLTGAKAGNYEISNATVLSTNEASITTAPLHITAQAKTKVFGEADPAFTYAVTGGQLFVTDQLTGMLGRDPGTDVGIYPIILNTLTAGSNYSITYVGADFSITKATQSITWTQQDFEIGCNGAPAPVTLTATSNSGLPVTYIVTNLAIASVNGNTLTPVAGGATTITATQPGDNNHEAATIVVKNFKYQLAGAIRQHWADAIFFDNFGGNYTAWQWYKNGNPVSGANNPYYSESTELNGNFHVMATDKNGNTVESCPVTAAGAGLTAGIRVSPNPVRAGSTATVTCNYSTADLVGAKLILSVVTGTKVQEITQVNATNQLTMPAQGGLYVLTLILSKGQKASVNVLVK